MVKKAAQLPSIGIIGGGQLGRMFLQNSSRYGNPVYILEDDENAPAAQLTHHFIKGSLQDAEAIRALAEKCDILTYEIEHINTGVLLALEQEGKTIIPSPRILQTIQDKGLQKLFYREHRIPTADFRLVNSPEEWLSAMQEMGGGKFAAKSRKGGYDGKGVFLTDLDSIAADPSVIPFDGPVMIEKFIPCKKELAVLVAVGRDGDTKVYPSVDMAFHPVSNLVIYLFTPSDIPLQIEQAAQELALQTVKAFGGAGLFAVEFFLDQQDQLWVNEIAPRPHNSAHHTIEGCYTSQFDQLFRILTGLPLGATTFRQPAVMLNLVGPENGSGAYALEGIEEAASTAGVYIHLYGKQTSKPHRKLGHVTVVADTLEAARSKADYIDSILRVAII